MPALILPRRFNSQPPVPAGLNPSVIPDGVKNLIWTPNNGVHGQYVAPVSSGLDRRGGQAGICSNHASVANAIRYPIPADTGDWTLVFTFELASAAGTQVLGGVFKDMLADGFYIEISGGAIKMVAMWANGNWSVTTGPAVVANRLYTVTATTFIKGSRAFYLDGELIGTSDVVRTPNPLELFTVGQYEPANINSLIGRVYLAGCVNAVLPNAMEISGDPWQIFRARPRVLYFDVAAGGIPTLSFPAATSITASSAVPQVTLTF